MLGGAKRIAGEHEVEHAHVVTGVVECRGDACHAVRHDREGRPLAVGADEEDAGAHLMRANWSGPIVSTSPFTLYSSVSVPLLPEM